ncbi:MAG: helix-turn-helix domain-containing protein [Candidatus Bathyarchaeota archaeon]|nr:helix-turn-helix domain-containing protein [Candidatus Bathyarchaeota archaeon]
MDKLISNDKVIDEIIVTLIELGLNTTQAKLYASLANTNNITATKISELTKIARSDTYQTLYELSKIGLVEIIPEQPKRFHAVPLKEGFSILISRRQAATVKLAIQANMIVKTFKENAQEKISDEEEFTVFAEKTKSTKKANSLASKIEKTIFVMGSNRVLLQWVLKEPNLIEDTVARGVTLRVIFPQKEKDDLSPEINRNLRKYPTFKSRLTSEPISGTFAIYDNKTVLLNIEPNNGDSKYHSLVSNNEVFVNIFISYFESIWRNSEELN